MNHVRGNQSLINITLFNIFIESSWRIPFVRIDLLHKLIQLISFVQIDLLHRFIIIIDKITLECSRICTCGERNDFECMYDKCEKCCDEKNCSKHENTLNDKKEIVIEYGILFFCPLKNGWSNMFQEGYGPESGDFYRTKREGLRAFNSIRIRLRDGLFSKIRLVEYTDEMVHTRTTKNTWPETLFTKIIEESETDAVYIKKDCIKCGCEESDVYNFNNPEDFKRIEKGTKKYVSPCEGMKKNEECVCDECDILWYCDGCRDSD